MAETPPISPGAPPAPASATRGTGGLAFLLVGALVGGLVGIGAARAIVPALTGSGPAATSAPAAADPDAQRAAIREVLRRANAAQAAAFAKNDPSLMRATSTDEHYAEMTRINGDLARGGVTKIELLDMSFGDIAVDGTAATATTTETWRTTYAGGAVEQRTDHNDYVLALAGSTWKIASNSQPADIGVTAPTQPRTPVNTTAGSTSRNWSGYVATAASSYTGVTGTWVVATPDPSVAGIDATWVGIGGANTTDLIQAGTEATVDANGTVTYDAWTETLPQSTRTISLAVSGGDTVSVSITERSADLWVIDLKNMTTGKSFTTTIGYRSSKSSAEWIEEAPSIGRGIAPLDSFGTVRFSAGSTTADGRTLSLAGAAAKAVTMADAADRALAVPWSLGSDGSSFSVTRTSVPATSVATGGRGPGRRRG